MSRTKKVSKADVEELADLLSMMVENVVDNPDAVEVVVSHAIKSVRFQFKCAESDSGQVIGVQRQTINAIERVMFAAANARQLSVDVQFSNDRATHHAGDGS